MLLAANCVQTRSADALLKALSPQLLPYLQSWRRRAGLVDGWAGNNML